MQAPTAYLKVVMNTDSSMLDTNGKYQVTSGSLSPSSSSGWVRSVFAGQHLIDYCRRWKAQPDCWRSTVPSVKNILISFKCWCHNFDQCSHYLASEALARWRNISWLSPSLQPNRSRHFKLWNDFISSILSCKSGNLKRLRKVKTWTEMALHRDYTVNYLFLRQRDPSTMPP